MSLARVAVSGRVARSGRVATVRVRDPATILGPRLCALYEGDACLVSGGLATTIYDKSGTGNTSTSAAALTWNAASANFNGRPSWSFNGTSSTFQIATFVLGKPVSAIFTFFVATIPALVANATLACYSTQYQFRLSTVQKVQIISGGRTGTTPLFSLNTPMTVYGWAAEPVGSLQTIGGNAANIGDVLAAAAPNAIMAASAPMQIGATNGGGSLFFGGEVAAIVIGSGVPSSDEEAALVRWAQRKYGVAG